MADWWGRRTPIAVGCLLMVLGGFIGAFCNGYGSMYNQSLPFVLHALLIPFKCTLVGGLSLASAIA